MDFLSQKHIFAQLGRKFINRSIIAISKLSKRVCCPICNWKGYRFVYFGRRKDAQCPKCGSLERHRLQKLVIDKMGIVELVKGGKILHFAPEKFFEEVFKKVADVYISADIQPGRGMIIADIRNICFKDNIFSIVYASHVLEHLKEGDDIIAIKEVYRVLKPGGVAILPIPVHREGETIEYGFSKREDSGHFRSPGTEYFKRFKEVGFGLQVFSSYDFNYQERGLIVTKPGFGTFPDYVPVLREPNNKIENEQENRRGNKR